MPLIFLIGVIFFVFLYLFFVSALSIDQEDTRLIGYEYLNESGDVVLPGQSSYLHIWNSKDDYYFNKSSGIQFSNHFQEFWARNIFCIGYYSGTEWVKIKCADELNNFNKNIQTDNLTYVNVTLWKDINYGAYDLRLGIRYHLRKEDKNLSIQISIKNIGENNITNDLGFAWRVTDIKIGGDEINDKIYIDTKKYWLNESLDLSFTDMFEGYYLLYDEVTKKYLWLRWNNNLNYKVEIKNTSQYNAPVTLGVNVGTLAVEQQRTTTLNWYDSPTSFFEDWEDQNFDDWSNTGWEIDTTGQYLDAASAICPESTECDMYTTVSTDTSADGKVNVSFRWYDDDCDVADAITWSWNDSGGNWDIIGTTIDGDTLGQGDDGWYSHSFTSSDSQYLHTGFAVRFSGSPGNNENYWVDNITILGEAETDPPEVTITNPSVEEYNYSSSSIEFNVTTNEVASCNYTLDIGVTNITMTANGSNTGFNATNSSIADGNDYTIGFYCWDLNNNLNDTETRAFNVDTTAPWVNLTSPANNTLNDTTNTIDFYFNTTDTGGTGVINCTLVINNILNESNIDINVGEINNITTYLPNEDYLWSVNCTDIVNNIGASQTFNISVNVPENLFPNVTLNQPEDYANLSYANVTFNCTSYDDSNLKNVTLYFNGSGGGGVGNTIWTEDFETGWTTPELIGANADWFDNDAGPTVTVDIGFDGTVGLTHGTAIFIWSGKPFNWTDKNTKGVIIKMDFKTDASGNFDDDRLGWMNQSDSVSSSNIFSVQMENTQIEGYWDGVDNDDQRLTIASIPALTGNKWHRFIVNFTKLTDTSVSINATLWNLTAGGELDEVVASGYVADTDSTAVEKPHGKYFTGDWKYPAYKNYVSPSPADNAYFEVVNGTSNGAIAWHPNQTIDISGIKNETTFQVNLTNGSYTWNCYVCDTSNQCNFSVTNYTVNISTIGPPVDNPPTVSLDKPDNATTLNYTTIQFNFTAQDDYNLTNATLYFCNVTTGTCDANGFAANTTINISGTTNQTNITVTMIDNRTYWWNIYVCDNSSQCAFNNTNYTLYVNTSYIEIVTTAIIPTVETDAVDDVGDIADDPAIWLHPTDSNKSFIIGTSKTTDAAGGLYVYNISGDEQHFIMDGKKNNVDIRYNFTLGGVDIDIAAASDRYSNMIMIYEINQTDGNLTNITGSGLSPGWEPYGFCLYHNTTLDKYYAFVNNKSGNVFQYLLSDSGSGKIDGTLVRQFNVSSQPEAMVADDELGYLYVGEETVGIWKFNASEDADDSRISVDNTTTGHIPAEVEGLTIYYTNDGEGYLLASSQTVSKFFVYNRTGNNDYIMNFSITENTELSIDAVSQSDGIDVISTPLGTTFPQGVFITQDDVNTGEYQNFKLIPWNYIANNVTPALTIDTDWNPRGITKYTRDASQSFTTDFIPQRLIDLFRNPIQSFIQDFIANRLVSLLRPISQLFNFVLSSIRKLFLFREDTQIFNFLSVGIRNTIFQRIPSQLLNLNVYIKRTLSLGRENSQLFNFSFIADKLRTIPKSATQIFTLNFIGGRVSYLQRIPSQFFNFIFSATSQVMGILTRIATQIFDFIFIGERLTSLRRDPSQLLGLSLIGDKISTLIRTNTQLFPFSLIGERLTSLFREPTQLFNFVLSSIRKLFLFREDTQIFDFNFIATRLRTIPISISQIFNLDFLALRKLSLFREDTQLFNFLSVGERLTSLFRKPTQLLNLIFSATSEVIIGLIERTATQIFNFVLSSIRELSLFRENTQIFQFSSIGKRLTNMFRNPLQTLNLNFIAIRNTIFQRIPSQLLNLNVYIKRTLSLGRENSQLFNFLPIGKRLTALSRNHFQLFGLDFSATSKVTIDIIERTATQIFNFGVTVIRRVSLVRGILQNFILSFIEEVITPVMAVPIGISGRLPEIPTEIIDVIEIIEVTLTEKVKAFINNMKLALLKAGRYVSPKYPQLGIYISFSILFLIYIIYKRYKDYVVEKIEKPEVPEPRRKVLT